MAEVLTFLGILVVASWGLAALAVSRPQHAPPPIDWRAEAACLGRILGLLVAIPAVAIAVVWINFHPISSFALLGCVAFLYLYLKGRP